MKERKKPIDAFREWEWLIENRLRYLLLFVLRHLGPPAIEDDAEEILDQFFEHLLPGVVASYDATQGMSFWNCMMLHLRCYCSQEGRRIRNKQRIEVSIDENDNEDHEDGSELELEDKKETLSQEPLENEAAMIARQVIDKLPDKYSEVILLHYGCGLSVTEIAASLGKSEASIRVRLYRGRRLLADSLKKRGLKG